MYIFLDNSEVYSGGEVGVPGIPPQAIESYPPITECVA